MYEVRNFHRYHSEVPQSCCLPHHQCPHQARVDHLGFDNDAAPMLDRGTCNGVVSKSGPDLSRCPELQPRSALLITLMHVPVCSSVMGHLASQTCLIPGKSSLRPCRCDPATLTWKQQAPNMATHMDRLQVPGSSAWQDTCTQLHCQSPDGRCSIGDFCSC